LCGKAGGGNRSYTKPVVIPAILKAQVDEQFQFRCSALIVLPDDAGVIDYHAPLAQQPVGEAAVIVGQLCVKSKACYVDHTPLIATYDQIGSIYLDFAKMKITV
jgi:hypothetical protein